MWDKVAHLLREHGSGAGARSSGTKSGVLIAKLFDDSGGGRQHLSNYMAQSAEIWPFLMRPVNKEK